MWLGFFCLFVFLPQLAAVIPWLYSEPHVNLSHLPHCAYPGVLNGKKWNTKEHGWGTLSPSAIQLLVAWPKRSRLKQPLGCRYIQQRNLTHSFLSFSAFQSQTVTKSAHSAPLLFLWPLLPPGSVTGQGQGSGAPSPPFCCSSQCLPWSRPYFCIVTSSKWQAGRELRLGRMRDKEWESEMGDRGGEDLHSFSEGGYLLTKESTGKMLSCFTQLKVPGLGTSLYNMVHAASTAMDNGLSWWLKLLFGQSPPAHACCCHTLVSVLSSSQDHMWDEICFCTNWNYWCSRWTVYKWVNDSRSYINFLGKIFLSTYARGWNNDSLCYWRTRFLQKASPDSDHAGIRPHQSPLRYAHQLEQREIQCFIFWISLDLSNVLPANKFTPDSHFGLVLWCAMVHLLRSVCQHFVQSFVCSVKPCCETFNYPHIPNYCHGPALVAHGSSGGHLFTLTYLMRAEVQVQPSLLQTPTAGGLPSIKGSIYLVFWSWASP